MLNSEHVFKWYHFAPWTMKINLRVVDFLLHCSIKITSFQALEMYFRSCLNTTTYITTPTTTPIDDGLELLVCYVDGNSQCIVWSGMMLSSFLLLTSFYLSSTDLFCGIIQAISKPLKYFVFTRIRSHNQCRSHS